MPGNIERMMDMASDRLDFWGTRERARRLAADITTREFRVGQSWSGHVEMPGKDGKPDKHNVGQHADRVEWR